MKNSPNVKMLPKYLFTEAVIFAGSDAWSHAKGWEEGLGKQIAGDSIPPVYLGPKQLKELDHLRIVDDGRMAARVYLAGEIQPMKINDIGIKLARAGVQDAKLFWGIPDREPEDWRDYLKRIREDVNGGDSAVCMPSGGSINLIQRADNEKALMLAQRYEGIAIHAESEAVYLYREGVWVKAAPLELSREMVAIYNENHTNFSKRSVNNVIEALKIVIPVLEQAAKEVGGAYTNRVKVEKTGKDGGTIKEDVTSPSPQQASEKYKNFLG